MKGIDGRVDLEEARKYFKKAADLGCDLAVYALGATLEQDGQLDKALAYFKEVVERQEGERKKVDPRIYLSIAILIFRLDERAEPDVATPDTAKQQEMLSCVRKAADMGYGEAIIWQRQLITEHMNHASDVFDAVSSRGSTTLETN
jgi:TPR repeat protein